MDKDISCHYPLQISNCTQHIYVKIIVPFTFSKFLNIELPTSCRRNLNCSRGSYKIFLLVDIHLRKCINESRGGVIIKQDRMVNSSGLKWSVFIVQKLALHENGVEFRQQFNGAICTSLATPYDDVRRRAT